MLQIKNNKVLVNDKETTDPTLIGLAFLDMVEEFGKPKTAIEFITQLVNQFNEDVKNISLEEIN